jgi:para-nitrobenzyl esterase
MWEGVRDAFRLGPNCPQSVAGYFSASAPELPQLLAGAGEAVPTYSEDCLVLNVWTAGLGDGKGRPVMVWLHGGGFDAGSGGGPWYDGANLARKGDVVVVTLNHRLSVLGYLYLGELGGEKYGDSGNAGMLDIVAALEWVRDNIGAFGGDANNVTLFGESGGGYKISVLMAMPAARGLFHRAIVQSGSSLKMMPKAAATRTARRILAQLGLQENEVDKLRSVPVAKLLSAMDVVSSTAEKVSDMAFAPVVDGRVLPSHPFVPAAPSISADVPMLIGTTQDEMRLIAGFGDPGAFNLDEPEMQERVQRYLGIDLTLTHELISTYRRNNPGASPSDIYFAITTDQWRSNAILQAERKFQLGEAPVYMYLFAWQTRAFARKYRASHMVENPFVFANTDQAAGFGGTQAERAALANEVSGAWIAFARSGNPNHAGLPQWSPYTPQARTTMVFDDVCRVVNDPQPDGRVLMERLRAIQ